MKANSIPSERIHCLDFRFSRGRFSDFPL